MPEELRVRDLREQELLKKLYSFCPTDLVGDDAALLTIAAGHFLVVTTDMLVDQVHFSDRTTTATDVGWRAAAANLSDLAAMGATPLGITIALGLPGELPVAWVEQLYQGIVSCLQPFAATIVGGDICRSATTTVSITAFGQVLPAEAIKRNSARPGDAILVTGVHGASRAGLELLLHPEQGQELADTTRSHLIAAHQRPQPRLDVISVLHSVMALSRDSIGQLDRSPQIAGMDTSDGLADAVLQICRASRVGAQLERVQIPIPTEITSWIPEAQAIEWALYGGEDFELVLCLPYEMAASMVQRLAGAAIVGTITEGSDVVLTDRNGSCATEILSFNKGFQHF